MKIAPLIFIVITLAGCSTPAAKPTKPTLTQITELSNGGVCFGREDAIKLGSYILELEND